jgi:lipopolysaccharide export system protein LptA
LWFGIAAFLVALCCVQTSFVHAEEITFARPDTSSPITISADKVSRWQEGKYEVLHLDGNVRIGQQSLKTSVNAGSHQAILWVEVPSDKNTNDQELAGSDSELTNQDRSAYKVIVYLEDGAAVNFGEIDKTTGRSSNRIVGPTWLGRLFTTSTVDLAVAATPISRSNRPAIFERAFEEFKKETVSRVGWPTSPSKVVQASAQVTNGNYFPGNTPMVVSPLTGVATPVAPAQANQPVFADPQFNGNALPPANNTFPGNFNREDNYSGDIYSGDSVLDNPAPLSPSLTPTPTIGPAPTPNVNSGDTDIDISARDSKAGLNFKSVPNPNNPNERVTLLEGVRIAIDSPKVAGMEQFRRDESQNVTILADNVIHWQTTLPDGRRVDEFYLEGNVVFSKDRRVIYAEQMFYNVGAFQGTILNAEVLTPVPQYRGLVRLKSAVVQQVDENNLQAYGAAFTSSRLGFPRYWLQSENLQLTRQDAPQVDPQTGLPKIDRTTGQPELGDDYFLQANSNKIYFGGKPVFWWPRFRTNLSDPSIYLRKLGVNNDSIFGFQLATGWDLFQLLGLTKPRGTDWIGRLDYLSERGIAFGSEFDYRVDGLFGRPGTAYGTYDSWFINDDGVDFLGRGRGNLIPEESLRGKVILNHRHDFAPGYQLRAELGYISDRNFLEQFYEREWDTRKDAATGFWLERNVGSQSYNLTADIRINDFFTETNWLPRYDHFLLGKPLFGDRLIWNSHSHAGYAKLKVADAPINATDLAKFDPLAWEADVGGVRAGTRQEVNAPFQMGPVKVVPYALADVTYWQEDLSGNDLLRGYGQAGVRASLPVWKVDSSIQSTLWNVNGLAHKVNFDMDAFYSDASQDLDELPLYDNLDDNSQEHFRRRFAFDTFGIVAGGDVPLRYDERNFAFRSGLQGWVTSPVSEIADDLTAIKFGVRQRWQTKRGMPGRERIVDLVSFDTQVMYFPKDQRDNFGADFGMLDYDFRWHIGDRVSLVSDGYADFFSQGLRTISVGAYAERPEVGSVYLGYRMIEGPISSNIVSASAIYRMSDKWGLKAGAQVDFGETGTIGQRLGFVYIGESFLYEFGFNYDASRDNLGFRFGFEPRFIGKPRMFRPGNVSIPPAGSRWLE